MIRSVFPIQTTADLTAIPVGVETLMMAVFFARNWTFDTLADLTHLVTKGFHDFLQTARGTRPHLRAHVQALIARTGSHKVMTAGPVVHTLLLALTVVSQVQRTALSSRGRARLTLLNKVITAVTIGLTRIITETVGKLKKPTESNTRARRARGHTVNWYEGNIGLES